MRLVVATVFGLIGLALAGPAWADVPQPGLVASYAFEEGSGSVVTDSSGNGHVGSVSGATWAPGRYGSALSFNGSDASVLLGGLGTFYTGGFTLEAWVQKQTTKNDVAVLGTWTGAGGPMIWVDHIATRYHLTLGARSLSDYLDSGLNPAVGQWQHIAASYDGTTARFYVDGTQVASRTVDYSVGSSNTWRIGAYGSAPGGFFDGLIDDVRIYDRALSAAEVQTDMSSPIGIANPDAPSAPGQPGVTARTKTSLTAQWDPSTDNVAVAGYTLYVNGGAVGTTTSTSHTFQNLTCATNYELGVEAFDAAGNTSARTTVDASTLLCGLPVGLVASYDFDDGSGATLADTSGNGHPGTVAGATWAPGRYGTALSFNGSGASVDLGGLGTFYTGGFTFEAWVQKATVDKKDVAVVGSWTGAGSGPMLWVDHLAGHYQLTMNNSLSTYLDSGKSPVDAKWQHLAASFDGATARFYVDGILVASRAVSFSVGSSNTWRIGAYGSPAGGFFDGLIDDVRIYNRALPAGEIQVDMSQPVDRDRTAPTAPGTLTATGALGTATLAWGAATDDRGVDHYNVHRSTTAGFTPSAANRIAQPTGTGFTNTGLASGTYYYRVTAEDKAGNVSAASNESSVSVGLDTVPPTVSITSPGGGASVAGLVTVSAVAGDDHSVQGVQFRLDGHDLGAEDTTSPYSVVWDSRVELNGSHTLTAVARDGAQNTTTSAVTTVQVANPGVSDTGLRAAYGLDEGAGGTTADSSGNDQRATLTGAGWTSDGRWGSAVSLNGTGGRVDLPALGTFYKTGFTYEAWVRKDTAKIDVGVLGSWDWTQSGGAMIWVDHISGHYRLTLGNSLSTYLDSGRSPTVGQWEHLAATYDGSVARFYVDGAQVASSTFTGNVGNANIWRIGAFGISPSGFFDGRIDNVRIYDRALSAGEIQTDMASRVQPDTELPTVIARSPLPGAAAVPVGATPTATFSEPMDSTSVTGSTVQLRDGANALVPATVTYDTATRVAKITPQAALGFDVPYTVTVKGGAGGVKDAAGNPLAADVTWSFTTQDGEPVLVVTSAANPFSTYLGEILRNEGIDSFTTIDLGLISPTVLSQFDVVLLGDTALTAGQVTTFTNWVNGGGNLIAMRPSKLLAGLLGLADAGTTLSNAYLQVNTSTAPGAGIVGSTIQFHGTADRYALNGASSVATLYSTSSTATANPAVTLRSVGSSGGQAAAFTYDLARSVVYTRQGNPAWAGQERDGIVSIRPDDMFFGAKAGDIQPDWLDTSKIAIPQADEQQRLLVNLITLMERDKMPLPHFWYLPRGAKAVVLLSGDDHAPVSSEGATISNFDRFKVLSPPGCVVANWECVRSTSYIFSNNPMTPAQANAYTADGFEVGLHPVFGSCPVTPITQAELSLSFTAQINQWRAAYPGLPGPASSRTHCVFWPDWASAPKVELSLGIRLDANYYHYPASWIGATPGFMNGAGFPMRFADLDGTPIDVYQQNTNLTDESGQDYTATMNTLLDNALGPQGFYGAFGTNIHTDNPAPSPGYEAIVASAQARGVPLISFKQMLDWVDGRNASTIRDLAWSGGSLTFNTSVAAGANGLQTMLPAQGPSGTLTGLTCGGSPKPYTLQTVKGVQYARFGATNGSCQAVYS